jgi:hypothetical protein
VAVGGREGGGSGRGGVVRLLDFRQVSLYFLLVSSSPGGSRRVGHLGRGLRFDPEELSRWIVSE